MQQELPILAEENHTAKKKKFPQGGGKQEVSQLGDKAGDIFHVWMQGILFKGKTKMKLPNKDTLEKEGSQLGINKEGTKEAQSLKFREEEKRMISQLSIQD